MNPQELPRVGGRFLRRALLAGLAIVLLTATAVSAAVFLEVNSLQEDFNEIPGRDIEGVADVISRGEAGQARTFMILGTDERLGVDEKADPRSDTIILVRLDPDKKNITVMSIPRDLKVDIPGYSEPDRINTAFTLGGPKLTVKTVRALLAPYAPGGTFKINHLVTVNFGGFRRAIDYIGGVYVDIDRDYFNNQGGPGGYATIDIDPGYQKLDGRDALDYVRYRHGDNDLIRAARQQDFIRQVKQQDTVSNLLNFSKRHKLVRVFRRYFRSDPGLRDTKTLFSVLKLLLFTARNDIQEVRFRIDVTRADPSYLYTTPKLLKATVDEFFSAEGSDAPRVRAPKTAADREFARKSKRPSRPADIPGLEQARPEGENMAVLGRKKVDFPFYFPSLRTKGSRYAEQAPRTYTIRDGDNRRHRAYRLTLFNGRIGEYYGVQGMSWKTPPILDNPDAERVVAGRRLKIYRDGRKVRLVAWQTDKAAYWVTNTLNLAINSRQMVGIAASLRRLGQK